MSDHIHDKKRIFSFPVIFNFTQRVIFFNVQPGRSDISKDDKKFVPSHQNTLKYLTFLCFTPIPWLNFKKYPPLNFGWFLVVFDNEGVAQKIRNHRVYPSIFKAIVQLFHTYKISGTTFDEQVYVFSERPLT